MAQHGFGIVGCGMIAEFHARAIADLPRARLVAAYSRDRKNAARIAELAPGCAIYTDLGAMLARDDLTVVNICTPSGAHLEPAVAAAKAGKHVVVEKPLEVTLARCDKIIAACDAAGVRLCTIFPSRFSPANIRLFQAIRSRRFGRLTLGDVYVKWWRTQKYYESGAWRGTWQLDGGGALMNQAIHHVDLLQWLMGPVAEVTAFTGCLAHKGIEVEDTAVASLRFQSGALGVIEAATSSFPGWSKRVEIHGVRGSVAIEQDTITRWQFARMSPLDKGMVAAESRAGGARAGAADPRAISYAGHRDQLAAFLRAIDRRIPPIVDGREGRKSVEIIRAIYRAARTGRSVALPLSSD